MNPVSVTNFRKIKNLTKAGEDKVNGGLFTESIWNILENKTIEQNHRVSTQRWRYSTNHFAWTERQERASGWGLLWLSAWTACLQSTYSCVFFKPCNPCYHRFDKAFLHSFLHLTCTHAGTPLYACRYYKNRSLPVVESHESHQMFEKFLLQSHFLRGQSSGHRARFIFNSVTSFFFLSFFNFFSPQHRYYTRMS